ncbi:hypothetical protein [Streptomyces collinus]|uniref:Uncharacterized protein n=1 Tax=Streptomyces collinus (strain DSM 40733 / Tue 365) TaxID=1214242 RepID=S5VKQ6_STRC3|nr:hypothetical protein [Streptomyces collinus]AGS71167.1 hypothetical protein B446_21775 [Streptomyces collinus Tu 365]UJA09818.1 hypothetical protein HGI10_37750 [Streptomyces collinus]UJA15318.1 hypothetical protein HGI09_26370 [Streptomyces collinus]
MYPEQHLPASALRDVAVHQPAPITPAAVVPAPVVLMQPGAVPAVASIVLPNGRIVTGYAVNALQPEPLAAKPPVSRTAVNVALGGVGFLAVCGGLLLLTTFITALTALITQLIILAAVLFGGWIAVQVFSSNGHKGGTTVHIRRAVFKRNHFHS